MLKHRTRVEVALRIATEDLHKEQRATLKRARGIAYEVVRGYWASLGRDVPPLRALDGFESPLEPPTPCVQDQLRTVGADLATVSPLDASFVVGELYTALLPKAYRARHGIYFTPPTLTRRLLELVHASGVDLATARVLDPACGGGAFLAPVATAKIAALRGRPPGEALEQVVSTLRGFEIDPFSAWLSQVFVEAVLLPLTRETGKRAPIFVEVRDALKVKSEPAYDLVIGNPPYGRVKLPPEARAHYARSLFGHANLYGLFTDQALRLIRPGGRVAFVTPTSFLAGQYFMNLRRLLATEGAPETLEFVSDRDGVFAGVLQETLLTLYRTDARSTLPRARLLEVHPDGLEVVDVGTFELPSDPSDPWMIPRTPEQHGLVEAAKRCPTRLRDLGYRVSTGPLVWNRYKSQLRTTPGENRYPLVWAEAITSDGRFVFRAEKRNHTPYFEVRPDTDDWLKVDMPCVLLQRTTSKEQARRLIAAELPDAFLEEHGAAVVENHLNMIYAPGDEPRVPPRVIAAVLNSRVVDELFRCVSGSVAVSAFELEALPFPDVRTLERICEHLDSGVPPQEIDKILKDAYRDPVAAPA